MKFSIAVEKSGKTLQLLKSGSKKSTASKKRKVIPLLGKFAEYQESKKKPVAPQQPAPMQMNIDSMLLPQTGMAPAPENKKKK